MVTPFSFALHASETIELLQPNAYAASVAARLCGAIVKPTTGTIVVGEFDTRLQAPEAKRRVGFVDRRGFLDDERAFHNEVAFHADVWGIAAATAHERAHTALTALLTEVSAPVYERGIALALVADITTLVLDLPSPAIVARLRAFAPQLGIIATSARSEIAGAAG